MVKPWFEKYALSAYGFVLQAVTNSTFIDRGNASLFEQWPGAWVLADATSPLWPEVQATLLPSSVVKIPGPSRNRQAYYKYQDAVGRALGYPVKHPRGPTSKDRPVHFCDATEHEKLQDILGGDTCCVHATTIQCDEGNPQEWFESKFNDSESSFHLRRMMRKIVQPQSLTMIFSHEVFREMC